MEHLVLNMIETARGRLAVAGLLVVVGAAFCLVAWPDVHDARRLRASRAEADAEVVETRTWRDQHFGLNYGLRYRFRAAGSDAWYTRQDCGTGRGDLWSTLPQTEWERARAAGTVRVVYVPADPRVNRPAAAEGSTASDATGGLIIGAACLAGGAAWLAFMGGHRLVAGSPERHPTPVALAGRR